MKIAVYSIAKNEEKFAGRWAENCREADYRVVLDTGSADQTVSLLEQNGVTVFQKVITPWRFDDARNAALDLVPEDAEICISLDLDELLSPGWRSGVENAWREGMTHLRYRDVRNWHEDGRPQRIIHGFKIHKRYGFRWEYAIHEILKTEGSVREGYASDLEIHHRPDAGKSRNQYGDILERYVKSEPAESHYRYFWAQDLISRGQLERAIQEFGFFLNMETPDDFLRRSNAYRLRAWCRQQIHGPRNLVFLDLIAAASESPLQREAWADVALFSGECHQWYHALAFTLFALRCRDPAKSLFVDPIFWEGGKLDEMIASLCGMLHLPFNESELIKKPVPEGVIGGLKTAVKDHENPLGWMGLAQECTDLREWPMALAMALQVDVTTLKDKFISTHFDLLNLARQNFFKQFQVQVR